jgi:pimeloyl-ACP methyl ester carboxylesterase
MTSTRSWPFVSLVLAVALALPRPASAFSDPCLTGASAASDATDIAGVRARVEAACPCATFDGSTAALSHEAYVQCARPIVRDATDGTPLLGLFGGRSKCRNTLYRLHARSDCGYAAAGNRNPCCRHSVLSNRNRGAVRPAAECVTNPGHVIQNDCFGSHFVYDACSDDATNSCRPACGDGVKNAAEACDGGDAAACPGLCGADCTCPRVVGTTVDIASGAAPANTPGSPAVTVTNPKLLTQFGGSGFSLNNARYTRYRMNRPVQTPDAILILIPGFEGGAGDFKLLAENVIPRALADHGQVLEVWGYDRRTNQLEDLAGLDVAEQFLAPQVGLDWLFGGELGLTLHPALVAGPNRRAVFYNVNADVAFMGNWTNLVFSRDIDAVVAAADAAVANHNVFLGGHSAGTGFTARYAATDFNLTGVGPAVPGYAKVRGLVLLEGGGGSTGAPLTADSLDRIEAAANGGQFYATRDAAARCSDGTPCTIPTEATDCAATTPARCTPSTQAYSTGLLNPRILAAVEPAAIQGATDPDGGQIILQVDQLAQLNNNAIMKVPDLASLVLLPKATAEGGIGSFVDDDGLIASVAFFVATSVGAPGAVVGGLQTWLDLDEGPLPPAVLPNNGLPPVTLPGARWGQEKEVTRFDRLMTTMYTGGTNFVDWYFPVSGPGTTSALGACGNSNPTCAGVCVAGVCTVGNVGAGCTSAIQCAQTIGLDSSQLSVMRGRRDIENLTQAASVNVPVIAFGASNGLVPVPGGFVPFASSIGACTVPPCDGTPRVVSASTPNPAFPTLGDVNGGFEVYISEGFAHVDVTTAEDGPDNNVIGPLAAFLARNAQ